MKIATIWVGKGRVGWADEAAHEYSRRLPRHLNYTEIQVKPVPFKGDEDAVKRQEAERILAGETQRAMNELHRPSRDEE